MADKVEQHQGENSNGVEKAADNDPKEKPTGSKPRVGPIKGAQTKMGLEPALLIAMAKGALPPITTMAAYQSTAWAEVYTTLGYLVSIVSFLSMAMTLRAKFLNSLVKNGPLRLRRRCDCATTDSNYRQYSANHHSWSRESGVGKLGKS